MHLHFNIAKIRIIFESGDRGVLLPLVHLLAELLAVPEETHKSARLREVMRREGRVKEKKVGEEGGKEKNISEEGRSNKQTKSQ